MGIDGSNPIQLPGLQFLWISCHSVLYQLVCQTPQRGPERDPMGPLPTSQAEEWSLCLRRDTRCSSSTSLPHLHRCCSQRAPALEMTTVKKGPQTESSPLLSLLCPSCPTTIISHLQAPPPLIHGRTESPGSWLSGQFLMQLV